MELRDLRAFVAAAEELHFARAAARLHMSPSTMSELIRRLELELGTPLFTRTTRRTALTEAGDELRWRAAAILDLTDQASAAVCAIARGATGALRLGITPPAGPVIAPHLAGAFTASRPEVSVDIQRMWLPALGDALRTETIDAALTCGDLDLEDPHIATMRLGAEPLLVGLRAGDPLAEESSVDLRDLADRTLGLHPSHLFPAWHRTQRRILAGAGLTPPVAELADADLTARSWTSQPDIDWIMLTGSLLAGHADTVVRPVTGQSVPFTLSWRTAPSPRPVVRRFIESSLGGRLPDDWLGPGDDGPD